MRRSKHEKSIGKESENGDGFKERSQSMIKIEINE